MVALDARMIARCLSDQGRAGRRGGLAQPIVSDHCHQADKHQYHQRSQRRRADLQIPHEAFSPYIIGEAAISADLLRGHRAQDSDCRQHAQDRVDRGMTAMVHFSAQGWGISAFSRY
jgi:hypothetical protein